MTIVDALAGRMVRGAGRSIVNVGALALALFAMSPAQAHKHHQHAPAAPAARPVAAATGSLPQPAAAPATPALAAGPQAVDPRMADMMEDEARDRSRMSTLERLLDWLGRLHPMVVHFPLAFIPAALVTAIAGRRRPAFARPVQFLVIAGGVTAPVAALLGWLDAGLGWAGDDALLRPHRWLGTAIAAAAAVLAAWAWRKPQQDRGPWMIAGLGTITAALVVQGWYGGAMVHGIDHLSW